MTHPFENEPMLLINDNALQADCSERGERDERGQSGASGQSGQRGERGQRGQPSVWTLPYVRNPLFVSRERALAELSVAFAPDEFRALVCLGSPGIGKTQLAIEYAFRYRREYDAVLWVSVDTLESLRRSLAALTAERALGLSRVAGGTEAEQIAAVVDWLRANPRWLMIGDDAGTVAGEALIELLHDVPKGHVLLTSRRADWPVAMADLVLDRFSEADAVEFLQQRAQGFAAGTDTEAAAVALALGALPSALDQAAAYIQAKQVRYDTYLALLDAYEPTEDSLLGPASLAECVEYSASLPAPWRISQAAVSAPARAMLRVLALYSPGVLPRAAFDRAPELLREATAWIDRDAAASLQSAEVALTELARFALIELTPTTIAVRHSLRPHLESIPAAERPQWLELAVRVLEGVLVRDEAGLPERTGFEAVQPHVFALLSAAEDMGLQPIAARFYTDAGLWLSARARYYEAEPFLQSALVLHEAAHGPAHPELANHLQNLADVLVAMSRTEEAEPLAHRALRQQLADVLEPPAP